jgi:hypothetical protein
MREIIEGYPFVDYHKDMIASEETLLIGQRSANPVSRSISAKKFESPGK